ncbi:MAG TPA: alpha-ketoglutarate-dependent dioxygenase AlkB, partial [Myxococcales bacterium]|nr:alpha-ketoglutarate-dependent dioxygenase AlkB [Myxococcales bacterium]
ATVSLGNPRPFQLRPKQSKGVRRRPLTLQLGWGDLLVMGGSIQKTWEHCVPKRPHADPRLVVMFRQHDAD